MRSYTVIRQEKNGTTPDMAWICLSDGRVALRKPLNYKDFDAEQTYQTIANFFGLEVSPCIEVDCGYASLLSYDKRLHQKHAYDFDCVYSLQGFAHIVSEDILEQLFLLCWVDAVCNNTDRHNANLAFLCDDAGTPQFIVPPYDNCTSFELSFRQQALFAPTHDRFWSHASVFAFMCKRWDKAAVLLKKYKSEEFVVAVSKSRYFEWIHNQRDYLLNCL